MTIQSTFSFRSPALMLAVLFAALLYSCKPNEPEKPQNQYLLESTFVREYKKEQLAAIAGSELAGANINLSILLKSGAKAYRVTYKTKHTDGSDITASGAVIIPTDAAEAISMISYQHGTITSSEAAPSNFGATSEAGTLGAIFAGLGYVIVMPDYIGYGASDALDHPYEHRASLASASLDMIRAASELLSDLNDVKWNKNLYLTGFSEGGFATLALQKKIEDEGIKEFNLKASSCGAGAYNKTAFMKYIINEPTHGIASYNRSYLWVLLTYDRVYKLNKPAAYYFKEPYAAQIASQKEKTMIAASFNSILRDEFKQEINNGTAKGFIDGIADNDIYNWKPVTPTLLAHGDADQFVFYFNTQTAYDAMIAKGAAKVTLARFAGKDHGTAVPEFLQRTYLFFLQNP